jgi:hypothetical protein
LLEGGDEQDPALRRPAREGEGVKMNADQRAEVQRMIAASLTRIAMDFDSNKTTAAEDLRAEAFRLAPKVEPCPICRCTAFEACQTGSKVCVCGHSHDPKPEWPQRRRMDEHWNTHAEWGTKIGVPVEVYPAGAVGKLVEAVQDSLFRRSDMAVENALRDFRAALRGK